MSSRTPGPLLLATAIIEFATGVALLISPSLVTQLLLGTQLPSLAAVLVARIAGAALVAIGVSCWLEGRRAAPAPVSGLVAGLLVYNAAVLALLVHAALAGGLRGLGTWPTCALHLFMALWCARIILAADRA